MPKSLLLFFVLCSLVPFSLSQSSSSFGDPLGGSQGQNAPDCSDPAIAGTAQCSGSQGQSGSNGSYNSGGYNGGYGMQGRDNGSGLRTPYLANPGGFNLQQYTPAQPPLNPSQIRRVQTPPHPETEFEQMVADSVGRPLPLFGQSLFLQPPSTFSPVDWMQVPADYIIGPGDELQIHLWGQVEANLRVIVDRSGQVYIPQVGQVPVAGTHYADLEEHLKHEISKVFKNFNIDATIGRLRSIQVVVVGYARYPGTYTMRSFPPAAHPHKDRCGTFKFAAMEQQLPISISTIF